MAAEDPEKAMDVTDGSEEEDHDDEAGTDTKTLTSQLLANPAVMSALQGKLDSMIGSPSGYIKVCAFQSKDPFRLRPTACCSISSLAPRCATFCAADERETERAFSNFNWVINKECSLPIFSLTVATLGHYTQSFLTLTTNINGPTRSVTTITIYERR